MHYELLFTWKKTVKFGSTFDDNSRAPIVAYSNASYVKLDGINDKTKSTVGYVIYVYGTPVI